MSNVNPEQPISAFADGELSGQPRQEMLSRSASDEQVAAKVSHQRQLRDAVARAMDRSDLAAPAALRSRIEAIADDADRVEAAEGGAFHEPAVVGWIGRWAPAAAAAVLFIAALAVVNLGRGPTPPPGAGIIPVGQVEMLTKRHVSCSTDVSKLYEIEGMTDTASISALPAALAQTLGHATPGLDLSGIGYNFERIGSCPIPGKDAVHLIYRADPSTGRADRMSLWIFPDDGRLPIPAGAIYVAADDQYAHPVLVWRNAGIAYFLVGDSMEGVEKAADMLTPAGVQKADDTAPSAI